MTTLKKIYILILNWNNWKDTIECLESVFQTRYPNFQVICIDNASTDDSERMIKEWAEGRLIVESRFFTFNAENKPIPVVAYDRKTAEEGGALEKEGALTSQSYQYPLILIHAGGNEGYAGGNNVAIRYVMRRGDGAYLWILNNDTVVDKDALSAMVTGIEKNIGIGMAGSKLLYYDRTKVLQAAGGCKITPWLGNTRLIANNQEDSVKWDSPLYPDYICGASLLVRKEVVETIGLLDEGYFLYWEDADWGARARREKYRLLYSPASKVWHKEGGTSGGVNPLTDYYWTRNGLAFVKKFHPAFLPMVLLAYIAKYTIIRMLRRQPLNFLSFVRGVRDFCAGRTGK
jgi:GT2 family glycosyltransferase